MFRRVYVYERIMSQHSLLKLLLCKWVTSAGTKASFLGSLKVELTLFKTHDRHHMNFVSDNTMLSWAWQEERCNYQKESLGIQSV